MNRLRSWPMVSTTGPKVMRRPADNLPPYSAALGDAERGESVFAQNCADCHGSDGEGVKGKAGSVVDPAYLQPGQRPIFAHGGDRRSTRARDAGFPGLRRRKTNDVRGNFRRGGLARIPPSGTGSRTDRRYRRCHYRNATLNLQPVMTPNEPESHPPASPEAEKLFYTARLFAADRSRC